MAFLKNLFGGKDARFYFEKGNRLLSEGRFAEARSCYSDALEKVDSDEALRHEITLRRNEAGDGLAVVNLEEAERCLQEGDRVKVRDHLELAGEFAVNPDLVQRVELLNRRSAEAPVSPVEETGHATACGSCSGGSRSPGKISVEPQTAASVDHLTADERYEMLTAVLPDDLPRRYRAMGERFEEAYLLSYDGNDEAAADILTSLTNPAAQDIIFYERALILHRQNGHRECEALLRQALKINDRNPLCYLALVDLFTVMDRIEEALGLIDVMIAMEIQPAHAIMMKGDILEQSGLDEQALDSYAILLDSPFKKDAASKIIPILEKLGRSDEARQVFTRYVKGCC